MNSQVFLLLLLLVATSVALEVDLRLEPPKRPYRVLMLLPLSGKSHRTIFLTLANALARRGHTVELLVNHPPLVTHPNIREIYHGLTYLKEENYKFFGQRNRPWKFFRNLREIVPAMTRDLYQNPDVQDLYRRRKTFDVVIIDNFFNQMILPFAQDLPLITLTAPGNEPTQSSVLGNVHHPAFVGTQLMEFPRPFTLASRIRNTAFHVFVGVLRYYFILPSIQHEISAIFPDVPSLRALEKNQSLSFINSHYSIGYAYPLLPSQVEIAAIHCTEGSPLPQDLADWVEGAGPAGVVYFSLGTLVLGNTMPEQWRELFVQAFRKLPQRVVWKYEGDIPGVSDNVLIRKWLPQHDLLAHPSVKVFITHGGMLSIQEGIYHAKPMMVLPVLGDQPKNGQIAQNTGFGIMLDWEELSIQLILDSIENLISDARYKTKVQEMSSNLRDQPQTPLERAVFWTEYVIRHQGAPSLRSPAADLTWIEYLMIDISLLLLVAIFTICILLRTVCRVLQKKCVTDRNKKKTE